MGIDRKKICKLKVYIKIFCLLLICTHNPFFVMPLCAIFMIRMAFHAIRYVSCKNTSSKIILNCVKKYRKNTAHQQIP